MVRPILRQQWRRHQLRLRLLRAVHDDSTWGRCLVCAESVERGVWPGKKRSGSPGMVGRDWAEMKQLMKNEPLSLRPAEAVNHVPAVQANLATWPWSAKNQQRP